MVDADPSISEQVLSVLREAASKALVEGCPWFIGVDSWTVLREGRNGRKLVVATCHGGLPKFQEPNNKSVAEFIAACDPATVLALLDEIEAHREPLDEQYAKAGVYLPPEEPKRE